MNKASVKKLRAALKHQVASEVLKTKPKGTSPNTAMNIVEDMVGRRVFGGFRAPPPQLETILEAAVFCLWSETE